MARKSRKNNVAEKAGTKVWQTALYIRLSVEFNGKHGDSLALNSRTGLCVTGNL